MPDRVRFMTAQEAVKTVKTGHTVHFGSSASIPKLLVDALVERGRRKEFRHVTIHHIHTSPTLDYSGAEFEGIFDVKCFFIGDGVRKHVQSGYADYIPISLSETPGLYRGGYLHCNVALLQVSPPDENGMVSLGPNVDINRAAAEYADTVIAVINRHVPHTLGDALIPFDWIDIAVEHDEPLPSVPPTHPDEIEQAIGRHCAALVDDGACLQLGIGNIPNAVLAGLKEHRDLGIHSEMFSDGVLDLVERGVINGSRKAIDKGKLVISFLAGSQHLYDFVHKNPLVLMKDASYTNDPFIIAKNPKVTAINSAIQIDITGQICADSMGTKMYSGVGGQLDFIYGAFRSPGGKAIIAMSATTPKGLSKISATLPPGSGVVTPRNLVHYLVTEYGSVQLYGKTLQERARAIISVAHPDVREELERAAFERFGPHYGNR